MLTGGRRQGRPQMAAHVPIISAGRRALGGNLRSPGRRRYDRNVDRNVAGTWPERGRNVAGTWPVRSRPDATYAAHRPRRTPPTGRAEDAPLLTHSHGNGTTGVPGWGPAPLCRRGRGGGNPGRGAQGATRGPGHTGKPARNRPERPKRPKQEGNNPPRGRSRDANGKRGRNTAGTRTRPERTSLTPLSCVDDDRSGDGTQTERGRGPGRDGERTGSGTGRRRDAEAGIPHLAPDALIR